MTSCLLRSVPAFLFTGMLGGQPAAVSRFFGVGLFSITNLIFIFESLSTLDSTFTSAAKLFGPEFAGLLEDGTPKPPQRASLTCAHLRSKPPKETRVQSTQGTAARLAHMCPLCYTPPMKR